MQESSHQKPQRFEERLSDRLSRVADGKWADILQGAGVSPDSLRNKKVQCPMHEGARGKFRFENENGNGKWHCAVCGHGEGMKLLMLVTGKNFTEAAKWVIDYIGDRQNTAKPALLQKQQHTPRGKSDDDIARLRASYAKVWNEARSVVEDDPVALYLRSRIPGLGSFPSVIRFHPGLQFFGMPGDDGSLGKNYGLHPCMVAAVVDETGRCCNIHRTFLTYKGKKLNLQEPDDADPTILVDLPAKKLMPSVGAKHYQIRLAKPVDGVLGIGEGIETALAAMVYSGVPTWSVVADSGMANFIVPDAITELVIFADNDLRTVKGGNPGLDAARKLVERQDVAFRMSDGTLKVVIRTPETQGTDMVDFLQEIARI
jgi:putative DNA primase/helicase